MAWHGIARSVKGVIWLSLTISVALISALVVEVEGQSGDGEKWHTLRPESDVETTAIYKAESDFDGRHYESTIYGRDLEGVRKWEDGKEPPISISSARTIAENALRKRFPQFGQFKLMSVSFMRLSIVDDWIIQVEFNGTDWAAVKPGAFENRKIDILVLLDGRAIAPTDTPR